MTATARLELPDTRARVLLAVLAAVILVAAVLAFAVVPAWLLLVAAAVPWLFVLGDRVGVLLAGASVVLGGLWSVLVLLIIGAALDIPILPLLVVAWTATGAAGLVACWRRPRCLRLPSTGALAMILPSFLGAIGWIGGMAVAAFTEGSARLSWVMLGDSANNVIFAREVIYRNGIGVGAGENPVPLPSALMAIVMSTGRSAVAPDDLMRHDIGAMGHVWSVLIALSCIVIGVTVGAIVRAAAARPLVIALASAGASVLPLSWFFTGYPVEYGFFNTHVVYPVMFAAVIAYFAARERPAIVLALMTAAATLLLAIWSPLVLIPIALSAVVALRSWRAVLATRGLGRWLLVVGLVQILVYGFGMVLPGLLRNAGFLYAPGGAFGFRKWMIVALAIAAIALAVFAFRTARNLVVEATVAVVVGSALGLGALLFVSRDQVSPWTYYPLKFAWLAATALVVLIVGLAIASAVRLGPRIQYVGLVVVAGVTAAFLIWTPSSGLAYIWMNPLDRIVTGQVLGEGDEIAERIFDYATPEQSHFLWHTDDAFEGAVNFWVMQSWSDTMSGEFELKRAAYGLYDHDDLGDLCDIVGWMGGGTIVHTAEADLAERVADECPSTPMTVVVDY